MVAIDQRESLRTMFLNARGVAVPDGMLMQTGECGLSADRSTAAISDAAFWSSAYVRLPPSDRMAGMVPSTSRGKEKKGVAVLLVSSVMPYPGARRGVS